MRLALFGGAIALALSIGGTAVPAYAQEEEAWVKVCDTDPEAQKVICLLQQELRTDAGQFLANVTIRETPGEARKTLIALVPVGLLIRPGVQLQVDGAQPQTANYSICFPNACYAELAIDNAYIDKMKRGGKLQMTAFNQQGRQVRFDFTLIGFTAAYDGEGISSQDRIARQEDLQRRLEQAATEQRDRLVAEQRRAREEQEASQ